MMKKLVILLAFLGLVFQTSCTSKDSQSDSEVAADYDSADLEKLEGDEALEIAGTDDMTSDQLPEDALGETTTTTETTTVTTEQTPGDSLATTEQMDVATNTDSLPADPFGETSSITSEPPLDSSTTIVDAPTSNDDSTTMVQSTTSTETSTYTETEAPVSKPLPSLQKVATTPWRVGGTLYNTVYFARPGDTLSSISQNIYGTPDRVGELRKGNTMFSRRDVKPGDKVYYNSPHRPDDASRLITYYEDNGIAPETYVANEGDNIRQISKSLLGYEGAWKEVWASNNVESKQGIPAGTELRYWKGGPVAAAPVPAQPSQEVATSSQPPDSSFPPAPDMIPEEQMPPQDMAQGELPPPPMPEPMDMPPPPPPMDLAQSEPPPPPPPAMPPPMEASTEEAPPGMDSDTTMALGVVGLAAAGLALLIVMRKKRKQKELEQQGLDNTHVGT